MCFFVAGLRRIVYCLLLDFVGLLLDFVRMCWFCFLLQDCVGFCIVFRLMLLVCYRILKDFVVFFCRIVYACGFSLVCCRILLDVVVLLQDCRIW